MTVDVSVSNEKIFKKVYSNIVKDEKIFISEDRVAFGMSEVIIIGLKFIYDATLSDLTWDFIKEQILPYVQLLFSQKRKIDIINVSIKNIEGEDYEISIPDTNKVIDLEIPEKLKLYIKK